jgi:hypothetical protein
MPQVVQHMDRALGDDHRGNNHNRERNDEAHRTLLLDYLIVRHKIRVAQQNRK